MDVMDPNRVRQIAEPEASGRDGLTVFAPQDRQAVATLVDGASDQGVEVVRNAARREGAVTTAPRIHVFDLCVSLFSA